MFIQADQTLEDTMRAYDLQSKVHCNQICMRINKRMNGLQEVGALANGKLFQHLVSYGCRPAPHTLGLWKHDSNKNNI